MTKPIKLAILIDDNEIDQRHYQRVLAQSDLVGDVMMFTYADEALAHLKANPQLEIDVIFLDINMPRMDGFEFLEAALAEIGDGFARIVVAMLTTSLNPADRERAEAFAVVRDFINKPLTKEHVSHVADILGGSR
jgi:CheY-like chemotaxis protein